MKETGIVRRIDELGRVVIPKEIRKTLRIKEGDPLEIYTDKEDLLFKKYSPIKKIENVASDIAESLYVVTERTAIICDKEKIVSAKGNKSKELLGKEVSDEIKDMIEKRKSFASNVAENNAEIPLTKGGEIKFPCMAVVPVMAGGDTFGAVILACGEEGQILSGEIKSVRVVSEYLGRYLL